MFATFVLSILIPVLPTPEGRLLTLKIGGDTRKAVVFVPKVYKSDSPVLFAFHGHNGVYTEFANTTDFARLWPNAYVVVPQGLPTVSGGDEQGKRAGWQDRVGMVGDRDLKLFDALMAQFAPTKAGKHAKVYVAGFSNGAVFCYLLWNARAKDISALATCGGGCSSNHLYENYRPKPVVAIQGMHDPRYKMENFHASVNHVLDANKSKAGLRQGPLPTLSGPKLGKTRSGPPPGMMLPKDGLFPGGLGGADTLVMYHPGKHEWDPKTSPAVVEFFKSH